MQSVRAKNGGDSYQKPKTQRQPKKPKPIIDVKDTKKSLLAKNAKKTIRS